MTDETQYWLVAQGGLTADRLPEYLAEGRWTSRNLAGHAKSLAAMRTGDRIAVKSTATRRAGVRFFNADRPVSVMTIHAVGTVTSVDIPAGIVSIDWDPGVEPREWYFFTYVAGLVQISPDGHPSAARVIDFAFHGGEQDLEYYLTEDPYWTTRYPKPPGFTWIPWYEEFATKLLEYREDRAPLIAIVVELAEREPMLQMYLHDQFSDGSTGPMRDVDPFTLFSGFNRGLTLANRQNLVTRFAEAFGIQAPIPQDFDGIPVANNQASWFVRYDKNRAPGDVDALWRVFATGIAMAGKEDAAARSDFAESFDAAQRVSGVRWNLTMGMYWCRPEAFPTLDGRSRDFNQQHFGVGSALDGAGYLSVRDQLLERMTSEPTSISSFPLLSYAAWSDSTAEWPKHSYAGFATGPLGWRSRWTSTPSNTTTSG